MDLNAQRSVRSRLSQCSDEAWSRKQAIYPQSSSMRRTTRLLDARPPARFPRCMQPISGHWVHCSANLGSPLLRQFRPSRLCPSNPYCVPQASAPNLVATAAAADMTSDFRSSARARPGLNHASLAESACRALFRWTSVDSDTHCRASLTFDAVSQRSPSLSGSRCYFSICTRRATVVFPVHPPLPSWIPPLYFTPKHPPYRRAPVSDRPKVCGSHPIPCWGSV